MKGTVFISYSVKDNKMVKEIVDTLEAYSIDVWKAPEKIPTGSSYAREIPKAIKACSVFLLVLSKDSQESIWVEKEVDMAVNEHKPIVPVCIDGASLNDVYQFYLNNVQMINYSESKMHAKTNMINIIKKSLNCDTNDSRENFRPTLGTQMKPLFEPDEDSFAQSGVAQVQDEFAIERRRQNILTENKVPEMCEYCAGRIVNEGYGVYRCTICGKENYDYFRKVRNYLDRVGSASAATISVATGVPRKVINAFFKEEKLEIPYNSEVRISCKGCGKPIRTGEFCEGCKVSKMKGYAADSINGRWRSKDY